MPESIRLLGPWHSGKSTIGRLLAVALSMPFCDLSAEWKSYWVAAGFDQETADRVSKKGADAASRYLDTIRIAALELGLADHTRSIVEVSALDVVYEDAKLRARLHAVLALQSCVILLLPSPDLGESERILYERDDINHIDGMDFNEHFVRHHSNFDLAKQVFYTKGKTPRESCKEILERMTPGADIILIGPQGAGKSTIGPLLAERLGLPSVPMDRLRWDYLPSPDLDESLTLLRERSGLMRNGIPIARFLLTRMANDGLAQRVVYTAGKTPEQTCDEIIGLVSQTVAN